MKRGSSSSTIIGQQQQIERCYRCRIGNKVPGFVQHKQCVLCDKCGAVQDFNLCCAHPRCAETTWSWNLDALPEELLNKHYFCCAEHANDSYTIDPLYIYKDGSKEPSFEIALHNKKFPMHMTVDSFIKHTLSTIGALKTIDPELFLLCVDSERIPGNQINFASSDDLLYKVALQRDANFKLLLVTRSEYDAQMQSYGVKRIFPAAVDNFFATHKPTKGTLAQVVGWLKERGLSGSSLTEAGTYGPHATNTAPYVVVAFVTEPQLAQLMERGFSPFLVCPYVLRKVNCVIILHCDNHLGYQDDVYTSLSTVWRKNSEYIDAILAAHKKFGIGPYGERAIDLDAPFNINQQDDEEKSQVEKRRRTQTTYLTSKDLETLGFKVEHQKDIVRAVKDSRPDVRPFIVNGANKNGNYFVVVPLRKQQVQSLLAVDPAFLTRECFLEYSLAMVDCGKDVQLQKRTCERLIACYRDEELFLQTLTSCMTPAAAAAVAAPHSPPPPLHVDLEEFPLFHHEEEGELF